MTIITPHVPGDLAILRGFARHTSSLAVAQRDGTALANLPDGDDLATRWQDGDAVLQSLLIFPLRNTVILMTTLTFKVAEEEARNLRAAARRAKLTSRSSWRRQIRVKTPEAAPVRRVKCRHTGAMIFAPPSHFPLIPHHGGGQGDARGLPVRYLPDVNVLVAWGGCVGNRGGKGT